MVLFLTISVSMTLIFALIMLDNGLHILKYGKMKDRWSKDVPEPVKKSVGYVLVIAGAVSVPLLLWGLFNLATGKASEDPPLLVLCPLGCSGFWLGGLVNVATGIIYFSD